MTSSVTETAPRMSAGERRAQILFSASEVFGERGYNGATTDQIAKAAGISQSYVVRTFGSKEQLFLEVLDTALERIVVEFRRLIAEHAASGEPRDTLPHLLGSAYVDFLTERGLLMALMQSFTQGHDPVIGEAARAGFMKVYDMMRTEAGMDPVEVSNFLAHGMLLNTLLGVQLPREYGQDPSVTELLDAACGDKLPRVIEKSGPDA